MMLRPAVSQILKNNESYYSLVIAVAKRAREITSDAFDNKLVLDEKPVKTAVDELIDRYGDPPKSVLGLVNVALTRNTASKLGIKEITQRGDKVLFFVKTAEVEQIQALYGAYKNRIRFFDGDKPYFAVTLEKKQKAAELMAETVRLMRNEE